MLQAAKYLIYDYFYFLILLFFSALMSHLPLLMLHSALEAKVNMKKRQIKTQTTKTKKINRRSLIHPVLKAR